MLVLRAVTDNDLPIFFAHQLDPDATHMAHFPSRDEPAFMAHWAKILKDEKNITRAILVDGQVAGNVVSWEQDDQRFVGYWLGKDFWGKGIATQALAALLKEVTQRPLYAYVAKHNVGSRRVLEKCGFTRIGEDDDEISMKLD